MELHPLGSIVKFQEGEFVVAGFGMIEQDEWYNYALLPYPTGITLDNQMILVNEVDEVICEGYRDEDHEGLEELVEILHKKFQENPNSIGLEETKD